MTMHRSVHKNSSISGFVTAYNQFHQLYDRFNDSDVASNTPPSQRKRSARFELNRNFFTDAFLQFEIQRIVLNHFSENWRKTFKVNVSIDTQLAVLRPLYYHFLAERALNHGKSGIKG